MAERNQQLEIAQGVKRMRENLPAIFEMEALQARILRHRYLMMVEAGFTPEEALKLCRPGD